MRIDVWSDIVCPWCAIGAAHLDAALADLDGADDVQVVWRSFELDPGAPPVLDGDYAAVLARKYGASLAGGEAMIERMHGAAARAGLEFHLERARPGNSFDAHRLTHLAAARGRQQAVAARFMRGYLAEGAAIGDHRTLAALAVDAGLDAGEVREALDSTAYAEQVRADEDEALRLGVDAVPLFLLGGRLVVPGAQPPDVLLQALRKVSRTAVSQGSAVTTAIDRAPDDRRSGRHPPGYARRDGSSHLSDTMAEGAAGREFRAAAAGTASSRREQ